MSTSLPVTDGSSSNALPSPNYSCLPIGDTLLLLNSGDDPVVLDDTFAFATTTCLIYSENIQINSSVPALPGKNIGLFCSQLILDSNIVTLDVSGPAGKPGSLDPGTGIGSNGGSGGSGGNVWLYVQTLPNNIATNLRIQSNGGTGGDGGNTTASGSKGGDGGPGGNAGTISIYYSSQDLSTVSLVEQTLLHTWPTQTAQAPFNFSAHTDYLEIFNMYQTYLTSANAVLTNVKTFVSPPTGHALPSKGSVSTANDFISELQGILSGAPSPAISATDYIALDKVGADITSWISASNDGLESSIVQQLSDLTSNLKGSISNSQNSDLYTSFVKIYDKAYEALQTQKTATSKFIPTSKAGQGGIPGYGVGSTNNGAYGAAGNPSTPVSLGLQCDGSIQDLDVDYMCASPEQCQMLLNRADGLFFANDRDDASQLYSLLVQRLAFVAGLETQTSSALYQAYGQAESSQLTFSWLSQLQSIFAQAKSKQQRLLLGQDMFGHPASWVPRLSYDFYAAEISDMLTFLETLENATTQYSTVNSQGSDIKTAIQSAQNSVTNATARIELLCGPNGVLSVSGEKITYFTPLLAQARSNISNLMAAVENDIRNAITIDPETIMDALSSVATIVGDPSDFNGYLDLAKTGYSAWTQVDDAEGNKVDKSNVIQQFGVCDDSIDSLNEAYSVASSGTITVGDPGALKIISETNSIDNLLAKFKDAIPDADREALSKALDDYVAKIQQRNTAVLSYNAGLQQLNEAYSDLNTFNAQVNALGQQGLELNPYHPAIYTWITKMYNTQRLLVMERINYAARAISYWGLTDTSHYTEAAPLQGYDWLADASNNLAQDWESAWESYGSNTWSWWPTGDTDGGNTQLGLTYPLSSDQLAALQSQAPVGITLNPNDHPFEGLANVRLNQVRLWIPGAILSADGSGRQLLMTRILHSGTETIQSAQSGSPPWQFNHDSVALTFQYNATNMDSESDIATALQDKKSIIFSTEIIQNDYTGGEPGTEVFAPIGPFTTWFIQVTEADNPGLDLSKAHDAFLEFCGRSQ